MNQEEKQVEEEEIMKEKEVIEEEIFEEVEDILNGEDNNEQ